MVFTWNQSQEGVIDVRQRLHGRSLLLVPRYDCDHCYNGIYTALRLVLDLLLSKLFRAASSASTTIAILHYNYSTRNLIRVLPDSS